ncbi:hypothetical protein FisN_14Hh266 [Fistulifera solaris]|uniref:Large subunit ribosomal protein L22 n=1 Tax=Fistulifera solaris TaxID=1519565 RepID=A0A1Z5KBD1_FISSO|nr:hypothetical protein FisN_14Hh266 [Fistulifera solaris]|eukprot:GAX23557.1 hypothetical protein FisN_14Hh266 [Fistulifera solaris]
MSSLLTGSLCRKLAGLTLKNEASAVRGIVTKRSALSISSSSQLSTSLSRFGSSSTSLYSSLSLVMKNLNNILLTRSQSTVAASEIQAAPTLIAPQIIHTEDGRRFAAFDMQKHPKLKPHIVKRRLSRMRTYVGQEKNIRHSPWKLNRICQLVSGLPLPEALTQLEFCQKAKAPIVQKALKRTANRADLQDGLQPSQLEVAECFATKGTPLKRIKTMGRGRSGRMEHKHSHIRLVLREIDFKLRIYQAPSLNQKKKWFLLQQQAERDGARATAEREEVKRLEREALASGKSDKK